MRDIHSHLTAINVIAPAVLDESSTPASIDRQGYEAVEIVLQIGAGGITFTAANKIEFKLTHSDDNSEFTAVTATDVLGVETVGTGGILKALVAAHAAPGVYRFGYIGGKRYLRFLADFAGTHGTGTPLAAIALLGEPALAPVADQA